MSLTKVSIKGQNLTCNELDNNWDYVLDLGNSTGILDCSKISQSSLNTCLSANSVITTINTNVTNNATAIGEVAQDLTDAQTALQTNINALTTLVSNQNTTIADLNTQIATLVAAFNALDSTVSAFNSRLLSVEGRLTTLEDAIASGIIVVWSGAIINIPTPFILCNGTNGTPDLRNRFIIGAGSTYSVNAVGGTNTHNHNITGTSGGTSLTISQMPDHNHQFLDSGHFHPQLLEQTGVPIRGVAAGFGGNGDGGEFTVVPGGTNKYAKTSFNTANINFTGQGSNEAHSHSFSATSANADTLPPYYALAYIMKV